MSRKNASVTSGKEWGVSEREKSTWRPQMIVCPRGVVLVKGAVLGDVIEWPTSAGHQLVCHVLQPRGARLWVGADEERLARERQGGAGAEGARKGDGEEGESVCSRTSLAIATLSRVSSHRRRFHWRHASA